MRVAITFAVLLAVTGSTRAAEDKRVTVTITARRPCWTYHGDATSFSATLAANQHVTVHMRGDVIEIDPKTNREITKTDDRTPDVLGPDNFMQSGEGPDLAFVTPRAGNYRFGFSPNAMLGLPGDVEICAR